MSRVSDSEFLNLSKLSTTNFYLDETDFKTYSIFFGMKSVLNHLKTKNKNS